MPNVLSIQSHVAYGHVGNAAAVFPLQRLGIDVWPVMTVQFSNHPGYGSFRGRVLPADHVAEVVEGLVSLGVLDRCDAVLTGYIGDPSLGEVALNAVARMKSRAPGALYACDPVMGDAATGLFVQETIPTFMRERALPAADILTPNVFELEVLAGGGVSTIEDAVALALRLIGQGPRIVLVTSLVHGNTRPGTVEVLCVTRSGAWRVVTPFLDLDPMPNGAGDMLSALFLGHLLKMGRHTDAAPAAMEAAVAAVYAVMEKTVEQGGRELALVAAGDVLVAPARRFAAEAVD
jgi:pyridoxine kinase